MSEPASPHVEVAAYLLGKLEADEAERFEAHLEGCADCRRHLEELGGLPALVAQAAPATTLPDGPRAEVAETGAVALAVGAGLPALPLAVIAVVAFDLFGGAVVNAAAAAKRRFHGSGRSPRRHLGFVVVHVQPFALASAIALTAVTVPAEVAWFAPVLLIKLLLGHLLPGEAAPRGAT